MPCAEATADKGYHVYGYDILPKQSTKIDIKDSIQEVVEQSDIIFVATPTPHQEGYDGREPTSHKEPKDFNYDSVKEVWFVTVTSLKYLGKMITGSADSSQLGGPIRIAKITGQVAEHGIVPFISIMAYISISLGLINLFPIPMLDGGHLMFYLIEKILGRPLSQKTQEGFFRIGLFLLLSLMFFVTFNDLKDLGLF